MQHQQQQPPPQQTPQDQYYQQQGPPQGGGGGGGGGYHDANQYIMPPNRYAMFDYLYIKKKTKQSQYNIELSILTIWVI